MPSNRMDRQQRRVVRSGRADRGLHGRPIGAPTGAPRQRGTGRLDVLPGAGLMRRGFALLIALAAAIVAFQELTSQFAGGHAQVHMYDGHSAVPLVELHAQDLVWTLPALAAGVAVGAALMVASASRGGIAALRRFGLPGLGRDARARANGMTWGAVAVLAVHFTGKAFVVFPGGHNAVAVTLGSVLGIGTFRLHRHAIEHEAYRTFNLVAMLLAVGSLASMSITPTGAWWTHNFSTLGTSDDIAAACFNVAIVVSGAGMAAMAVSLTRAVAEPRFGARRGAITAMRVLIVLIGVCLMGVGLVPIDGATGLHNVAASGAAASFAVLCLGVQLWAKRLPRSLVVASYASIVIEVIAMVAYDGIGVFNLTVFEIVAFTLVFAWLIALVAITHASPQPTDAASRRHIVPARVTGPHAAVAAEGPRARTAARRHPPGGRIPRRTPRGPARTATLHDVHRALRRGGEGADEPPDAVPIG
ncbi:DUF998 domain-containing protein [Agromyces sp. Soil535]|uniref:DUF998 domain-containing protein n=1 Tax=Agromyces sp. Soil535 TaxID=1736390 RepID=UPI00138F8099|nr:DUF998 domain-containing protein [Agromyces sp. Soil535]